MTRFIIIFDNEPTETLVYFHKEKSSMTTSLRIYRNSVDASILIIYDTIRISFFPMHPYNHYFRDRLLCDKKIQMPYQKLYLVGEV
jgi:hypothetical protein